MEVSDSFSVSVSSTTRALGGRPLFLGSFLGSDSLTSGAGRSSELLLILFLGLRPLFLGTIEGSDSVISGGGCSCELLLFLCLLLFLSGLFDEVFVGVVLLF
jgi:hypothetical protein